MRADQARTDKDITRYSSKTLKNPFQHPLRRIGSGESIVRPCPT